MRAFSIDLRERVVAFVEAGSSRREPSRVFGISARVLFDLWPSGGARGRSLDPKPQEGDRRRKLASFRSAIIAAVEAKPDITMPELAALMEQKHALHVAPASLSRFLTFNRYPLELETL